MSDGNYPWHSLDFMQVSALALGKRQLETARNRPGQAADVLFLHGVLRDWRSYYSILPTLHQELSTVALSFKGHGKSTPSRPYYVMDYVADVRAVLQRNVLPCVLYGHSLGAMVAFAAAAAEPDKVKALILEDPPFSTMGERFHSTQLHRYFQGVEKVLRTLHGPTSATMFEAFSNIVVDTKPDGRQVLVRDQRDELSRRFSVECLLRVDPAVLEPVNACRWLDGYDLDRVATQIRCPVTLLRADLAHGGMLRESDADLIAARLGELCRAHYFPDTGHSIHWSHPEQVINIIRSASAP